jgi:short-subunit dehydrogenase
MSTNPTVLILAATSDIGRATARAFAKQGHPLLLAARDVSQLEAEMANLKIRYRTIVSLHVLDVLDAGSRAHLLDSITLPDIVVCAVGMLGQQQLAESDERQAELVMRTNFEGPAQMLGMLANRFATRGYGTIVGISSVAGDRGRASNYVYGAAKAGFTAYLSGLRNRFGQSAIRVVTIKPGFVDTRMTAGMKLPALLTAQPEEVAAVVVKAAKSGPGIVYVRHLWRWIMILICLIPEPLFKRMHI